MLSTATSYEGVKKTKWDSFQRFSDRTRAGTLKNLTTYKKILCHMGGQTKERGPQRSYGNSMTGDIQSPNLDKALNTLV